MKEDFLHYVWQYKKFDFSNLTTVTGEKLTIINTGQYLQQAGPDFFNAQIIVGNQKWAGNVEIHLKSSDWYLHNHEKDNKYNNVVLHVVWEYDVPIFRKDNSEIVTLALKRYVAMDVINRYLSLTAPKTWIYCENYIKDVEGFVFRNWQERLFFERLQRKAIPIQELLTDTDNDWEAVLFYTLAKSFGLNTNGEAFLKMARSIPFSIIRKESFEVENLEALLFDKVDLLSADAEDFYSKDLQNRSAYMTQKHRLKKSFIEPVQFFKHRPDNFPTIRLAQLAMLYHKQHNLFSKIIASQKPGDFYELFDVGVSSYWETHYQFDKVSPKKSKRFSKSFINLLVVNTIVPFQFAFAKSLGKDVSEQLMQLMETIAPENNIIIEKFSNFGVDAKSAFESQSLLQLKNDYCNHSKCLQCAIGIQLLKQ